MAELRIKQRLALALDHLSQWSLCLRPMHGLDAASLHISELVRASYCLPIRCMSAGVLRERRLI